MKKIFFFFVFLGVVFNAKANKEVAWSVTPFNQKVFIENKGQFNSENGNESKILFGTSQDGVKIYFCANGLTYRHDEVVPMTEEEIEQFEREHPNAAKEKEKEGETMMKTVPNYFSVEWIGSNQTAEIISEEPVSFYYTYADSPIKANACKKIIYKNLYPNIDVEYTFPKDKQGIKYSIILHSGADASVIKIKYSDAEKISMDSEGNTVTESSFGEFIDHVPFTFYEQSKSEIHSEFVLTGNEISFNVNNYNRNKTIVIDPWITNPVFTGYNSAYDVNYDAYGNVYAYGAGGPFELVKFNNTGAIQWVFNAGGLGLTIGQYYYGDFAVDEISGTSYLVEGGNYSGTGAKVLKVNSAGVQTGSFPGDPTFDEMTRVEYNRCINKIVIGGGGIPPATNQAAILDTNMVNIVPVNILSTSQSYHDIALLAIDNSSNFCYMATTLNGVTTNLFDNVLVKCPIPNLIPLAFSPVPDGHRIGELGSVTYVNGNKSNNTGTGRPANGVNGMAVSPCWLYTYNSDSLKRWDKNTCSLINGIDASPAAPTYGGIQTGGVSIQISWGGLSADESDNIYVGVASSIMKYSTALTLVSTIALPDTVYDVKLGPNNKLYACGKGFVTEINTIPNNTVVNIISTPDSNCTVCNGTATASITACGSFNYAWSTSPVQTTQTATGLCPGNYSVTLTTNCFTSFTGTVSVGFTGSITAAVGPNTSICAGQTATLIASGGTNFLWNTGNTTTSIIINPTTTTNYSVIVSSGSCSDTASATVTVFSLPVVSVSGNTSICTGDIATLTASGGNSYSWSNGSTTNSISVNPSSTTSYSVVATNTNGCTSSATATVTVSPPPIASANNTTICAGQIATLTASGGGNYSWSNGSTTNPVLVSPTSTSTYSVIVFIGSCSDTANASVVVNQNPIATVSGNVTITSGSSTTLSASGGGNYSWSNESTTSSITVSPPFTTLYCVYVSNSFNCVDTNCITVLVTFETMDCSTLSSTEDFFIPNAFSPNGDNENDVLKLYYGNIACIKTYKFTVYNRWGEKVFESENPLEEWNGIYKEKMEGTAVFAYYMKATLINGDKISKKGNVSLIR